MSGRRLSGVGALGLLVTMAGCVNMSGLGGSSQYTCAAPDGVTCDSVSGTYANAIQQNLPGQRRSSGPAVHGSQPASPAPAPAASSASSASAPVVDPASSLRSQARVLRLWIKPWEDADGDLFDQAHVYVQVDGGRWQLEHVRQRIRDEFRPLRAPPAAHALGPADSSGDAKSDVGAPPPLTRPQSAVTADPRAMFPSLSIPPASASTPSR